MKKQRNYLILCALLTTVIVVGQNDTITPLEEVWLSDSRLYTHSRSQVVTVLKDSILEENRSSLASVLKFNSPVFIRENGYGMVASASFRGTTASQTAVVWNGININSQFTGQTDFNTIVPSNYENIAIRAGGGSVLYGSGAIGGSIHLNNRFTFTNKFSNELMLGYGSFNTGMLRYSAEASTENTAVYINLSRNQSDNDFKYPGTNKFNQNGDFFNSSLSAGIAHYIDRSNILKFYSDIYSGQRAFAGTLTAPSRSKYEDFNSRNLLEWKGLYNPFISTLKFAFLKEQFKYFENRNVEEFSIGRANSYIINYDLQYKFEDNKSLHGTVDFRNIDGEGSEVTPNSRNITAVAVLFNHEIEKWFYELSLRKEFTKTYESPFLFSIGAGYEVNSFYNMSLNLSRNFRIPTFNDLFWREGGTADLEPETSLQGEFGQTFSFKDFNLGLVAYLMEVTNLLRWIPDQSGAWRPVNTQSVTNYGLEIRGSFEKRFENQALIFNSVYAYTKTRDEIAKKELIYVPRHKATASLAYSISEFTFFYQFLYNGSIYTSSDNIYSLEGYNISNAGLEYYFGKKRTFSCSLEVHNLFNKRYQSLPSRPMPGRSINSSVTINF